MDALIGCWLSENKTHKTTIQNKMSEHISWQRETFFFFFKTNNTTVHSCFRFVLVLTMSNKGPFMMSVTEVYLNTFWVNTTMIHPWEKKTNKHRLMLGSLGESTQEFQILLNLFSMRCLEQSKRSIFLGKRKILGKYFRGSWSYLKWNGFSLHPCPLFSKHTVCTQACSPPFWTHTVVLLFSRQSSFLEGSVWFPCCQTNWHTCLFFPCPLEIPAFPLTQLKQACVTGKEDKKRGRKTSTSRHLHQNKNKQIQEKELLRSSKAFFLHQKCFSCGFRQPASQI